MDRERAYDIVDALRAVAARHEVGVARVEPAWVLAQPGVTSAIVGARCADQLTDTLAADGLELTGQDLAELDAVSRLPVAYPDWIQGDMASRLPQPPA